MPFYEYECQACKFYTEVMQKITDAPLIKCPSCGKRALRKLVSAPAFRLKGSGWYETDFKSAQENKRNLVGADKEEPKAEVKAQATDAKPAAQEAQDAKPADAKPAESKAASKSAAAGGAATSARNRVSVPRKAARAAAARKPTRPSRAKGARRRRR
ncbi:MAG TPA: zinc ribbon domain-containing protein [Steroidobacteraceae bacterium]|nr:zinc ribbon domain-containing protein [Steroidobacteraceae bacterium]